MRQKPGFRRPTSTNITRVKEDLAYDVPSSHLASFFEEYRLAVTDKESARDRLLLYLSMSADYAREHAEWARLLYLEIWPSVDVGESEVRHSLNDFSRVVLFLVRQGMTEDEWSADRDEYETAALLTGAINQLIITWLLYRRPRNLTRASGEMAERLLSMLESENTRTALFSGTAAKTYSLLMPVSKDVAHA